MFAFIPPEIRVPVGAQIDFIATSADVIHGFNIEGTRVNMMLIPGQIGRISHTFAETGEHLLICHEYCGSGHHTMAGRIIVEGSAGAPREGAGQ
jgi:cytochrome c oxidase subunit 2